MTTILLNEWLLGLGLAWLLLARLRLDRGAFQLHCQLVGTLSGGISHGVTWSLGRLVPWIASTGLPRTDSAPLRAFAPFVLYAALLTLVAAPWWEIPPWVRSEYGDLRHLVQLVNLAGLCIATLGVARSLGEEGGARRLYALWIALAIVHGLASLYQALAPFGGLPLIGISRPFWETADIAAVSTTEGILVRPGGLAGEPKTAAVLFGAFLLTWAFGSQEEFRRAAPRWVGLLALVLAGTGWALALSTSAYVGMAVAAPVLALVRARGGRPALSRLVLLLALAGLGGGLHSTLVKGQDYVQLLASRSIERLRGALDDPVRICLEEVREDPLLAVAGTGLGGSSFLVMRRTQEQYAYSRAPNVILVLLLTEVGLIGLGLLLGGVVALLRSPRGGAGPRTTSEECVLLASGLGLLILLLAGSGILLGFPLALGTLGAFATLRRRRPEPMLTPRSSDRVQP